MNYEDMSIEELEAGNIRLSNEKALIKQEQVALTVVLDRKIALRDAHAKFIALSDAEREALTQVIGVQSAKVSGSVKKAGE